MKKKNVIGALIMAGAILVSVPLGVNRSFARLREDVEDEYYYDSTGYAIYEGLDARVGTARNLLTLAERYVDKDPELDVYKDNLEHVVKLCENYWFDDIEDADRQVENNRRLGEAAQELADRLETLELSEKDKKYPAQLIADMESEQDKIERSSFNDKAREYNARLEKFPANLLGGVSGVERVAPFGEGSDPAPAARTDELS